ncbi:MAG TPA: prolyl oligopeptidase family serine peptidase [Casimicrobiaceae bacterium]|nr:prolyl oligopeptidase family serine peptidase [Casimicrobiaceae bacterium]
MPASHSKPHSLAATALACLTAAALAHAQPPVAPVRNVTDTYFGTTVTDPYRYMEDMKNPEVADWLKAQADYTKATLAKIPQRDVLLKEVTEYGDAAPARVSSVQLTGENVYYLKRKSDENIAKIYVRGLKGGSERLLVDPDKLPAPEGKHNAIDYFAASPDNKYLAYGLSVGGSEQSVLHVIEVASGKETGDIIDRANFGSPSWLADHRLLYNRLQKLGPNSPATDKYLNSRAYVHVLGANPDEDVPLLGAGLAAGLAIAPPEIPFVASPIGSRYVMGLIVNGVQNEFKLYVAPVASLAGDKTPWVKVADTADDVTGFDVMDDRLYLLTHKDASRFKVVSVSLSKPDFASAREVVPASEAVITGIAAAKDALYVRRMNGGISDFLKVGYAAGAKPSMISLPFPGDVDGLVADPRRPGAVFDLGGWTRFGGYFAYDPRAGKVVDTGLQPQSKYDNPANLTSTEVKVKGKDGTLVPLSIVHRKGLKLDGSNPTILYGYGAYGISQTPFYRPTFLPWFNRGGILAVAHVRGGGEYGEDWHKAGYKLTKHNTWEDAIACGEWLIEHKYTSSPKIAIMGGSAGGIFVGRSITERPDLFGAAIDEVPVSDSLRMEFTSNGPPNIPEFGTVKDEEGFKGLYAMSSYHHVKDGTKYPAVLLTTGINDPRVDAWEAGKMAARLQAASTSGKPILLRIDFDAGHGFGSTKKSQYEERADTLAFLFWQFGVAGFQPPAP